MILRTAPSHLCMLCLTSVVRSCVTGFNSPDHRVSYSTSIYFYHVAARADSWAEVEQESKYSAHIVGAELAVMNNAPALVEVSCLDIRY